MAKIQNVEIPYLTFDEAASPGTPASGFGYIYVTTGGTPTFVNDAGTETAMLGGAGGGDVATDAIWDAKGDLAVGTGANTAQKLTVGANGTRPEAASGETTGVKWSYPPGYEFDYVEKTSTTNITATTEGSADTIITGNSVSYDGSTAVIIEYWAPYGQTPAGNQSIVYVLLEDTTVLGIAIQTADDNGAVNQRVPIILRRKRTPSNASHTYYAKAYVTSGTGVAGAGAGGTGAYLPAYLRVTKA